MNRLNNLDYLRGIAALSIMLYHYLSWTFGRFSADTIFGKIGIYGVSIFYVLSGLTLYHVYYEKLVFNIESITNFFKKRFYRIFPLLWVVTIIAIIIKGVKPNFVDLFLNLTGLFGFFKWDVTFSTGVWSIGNELVFYSLFPFFMFLMKKKDVLIFILSLIIFTIFIYFAFIKLNKLSMPNQQTKDYFNPLNNLFVFYGGILIGKFFKEKKIKNLYCVMFILIGVLIFLFYPVYGNRIDLLTGFPRVVFTFSCFLICIGFYKLKFEFTKVIHKVLVFLGESSYSVYLLHSIIYFIISSFFSKSYNDLIIILCLSIPITLIVSYYSYNYFEKYFLKFSNKSIQ